MRPSFPILEDSIMKSVNPISDKFKQLFGIFGQHRYTVSTWYYLTLCNHHINKPGVALKCLKKTMKELHGVLGQGGNELGSQTSKLIGYLEILSPGEQQDIITRKDPDF